MFTNYVRSALRHAKYEILPSNGAFYGEIPGFNGVYAEEEWILLRISRQLPLPVVDGIELSVGELA